MVSSSYPFNGEKTYKLKLLIKQSAAVADVTQFTWGGLSQLSAVGNDNRDHQGQDYGNRRVIEKSILCSLLPRCHWYPVND